MVSNQIFCCQFKILRDGRSYTVLQIDVLLSSVSSKKKDLPKTKLRAVLPTTGLWSVPHIHEVKFHHDGGQNHRLRSVLWKLLVHLSHNKARQPHL